jgi:hypothetical protein
VGRKYPVSETYQPNLDIKYPALQSKVFSGLLRFDFGGRINFRLLIAICRSRLKVIYQGPLCSQAQLFNFMLAPQGGRAILDSLPVNKHHRPPAAGVLGPLTGIVLNHPALNIFRDPGVQRAVCAANHVNIPLIHVDLFSRIKSTMFIVTINPNNRARYQLKWVYNLSHVHYHPGT